MKVVRSKRAVYELIREWRGAGETIALVPTMGNLHEGHLALVRKAHSLADRVVASIYVNPTQFGEGEDFDRYPRTPEADLGKLERENCDLVFLPEHSEMYPFGLYEAVRVTASPQLASRLEGASRPGHFDGVVTVVARLFAIVKPDVAVFGEKDYQQLLLIRCMNEDLGFGIDVVGAETIRDDKGLALSSRNAFLDGKQLQAARNLNRVLHATARQMRDSQDTAQALEIAAASELETLGLAVDYVAIRNAEDLSSPELDESKLRILAAVRCGNTRLIDNIAI